MKKHANWRDRIKTIERLGHALEVDEAMNALWEGSSDLMCSLDVDLQKFVDVNPAFVRVLGWTQEELCSESFWKFVHPADLEKSHKQAETFPINHTQGHKFQNRFLTKSGAYVTLEWYATIYGPVKTYCAARNLGESNNGNERVH